MANKGVAVTPLSVRVTIRLTPDEAQGLDAACQANGFTRSDYLRRALTAFQSPDPAGLGARLDAIAETLARWERAGWTPPADGVPSESTDDDAAAVQASVQDLFGNW